MVLTLKSSGAERGGSVALHNKPLVPTRNGETPLLAAQRRHYESQR
jgi:hypothetical protein